MNMITKMQKLMIKTTNMQKAKNIATKTIKKNKFYSYFDKLSMTLTLIESCHVEPVELISGKA